MVKIFNTDCIAGMQKRLPDGCIDAIVTSPPYNLGIDYGTYDDHGPRAKYLEWMFDVAHELQAPDSAHSDTIDLQRCLLRLPEDQREVLLLVTLEDLIEEIVGEIEEIDSKLAQ